jgi:chromate transporter
MDVMTSWLHYRVGNYGLCYNLFMQQKTPTKHRGKDKNYLTLFTSTLMLSAFTFGGGYVIVPLMRKRFVEELGWITEQEMLDIICIAQSAPGPIAVNSSLLVGYRLRGFAGAMVTLLGTVLPPLVSITVIAYFYEIVRANQIAAAALYGMQAGIAAIIADVVLTMGSNIVKGRNWGDYLIMGGAFVAALIAGISVSYIILACGVIGAVRFLWQNRRREKELT